MKHIKLILPLIIATLVACGLQRAVASCGAASCPLNNYHGIRAGWVGLNIVHEYINQDQIYVGSSRSFVGAIPEDHDEVHTLNERNLIQIQFGLSDRFGLGIDVPFIHREHLHIDHPNGASVYQAWNFSGLGDILLTGQFSLLGSSAEFEPEIALTGGVKLATGVTDAKNGEGEEAEITIQPGTGSVDAFAGLNFRQTILSLPSITGLYTAVPLMIGVTYQMNGSGKDDYRIGNFLLAHVATSYQFLERAGLLLQFNARFQDYADVGTTDEPRENTGGTWVYISPGLSLKLSDALAAESYIQLPLYRNVNGIQQTAPYNLLFSLSYSVDLADKE